MDTIVSNWQSYYKEYNEGLGTTYERFILHKYFEKIKTKFSVESVMEAPCFGMTGISGINSMWWASHGIPVSIVDHDKKRIDLIKRVWKEASLSADCSYVENYTTLPFEAHSIDLAWNFASLWFVSDLAVFLKELCRIARKTIFICVPNKSNIFFALRFLRNKDKNIHLESINCLKIIQIMNEYCWKLEETGLFDVPPWPDIAMSKEAFLAKFGFKGAGRRLAQKEDSRVCVLDYFSGKKKNMNEEILRFGFLENSPLIFKRLWAHHQYFIFAPSIKKEV